MINEELAEYLKARFAEDEARYREVALVDDPQAQRYAIHECPDGNEGYIVTEALLALSDVLAKRRVLGLIEREWMYDEAAKALVQVYAGRPDFNSEWLVADDR